MAFKKGSRDLKRLLAALGRVRELDVAIADARKYRVGGKRLKKHRRAARRALAAQTNSARRRRLSRELDHALEKMRRHREQTVAPAILRMQSRLALLADQKLSGPRDFHKLRIAAKKARYVLENLDRSVGPLRELQNVLGRAHDLEVLQARLGKLKSAEREAQGHYGKARRMIPSVMRFAERTLDGQGR